MTTTTQTPGQSRRTTPIPSILVVVFAIAALVFVVLWITKGQELTIASRELDATRTQLGSVQQDLNSVRSQLASAQQDLASTRSQVASVQQELAAVRAQLSAASGRVTELTAGPKPEIIQRSANFQSAGFLGAGTPKLVVTARVANRGAAGMVRLTATANWVNGSRTGFADIYFAQGEEKPMTVELTDVPNTATYTAVASAR